GNRFFREGKIAIQNLDLGLKIVASFGSNVVLMCGCAEKKTCHRLVIALELQKRGYEVEEIESWTVAEPTLF
ncbi:MAG TPA: hypothetical protein VK308_00970, partial [Pyrinomonadaceae bacterium]|nr:hypothetical protein [Pyrinomonadaceae bacterium]